MDTRPILMSAPMVLAILREIEQPGTGKTMTRRIVKPQPLPELNTMKPVIVNDEVIWERKLTGLISITSKVRCPYGMPGDLLWVRETFAFAGLFDSWKPSSFDDEWAKHQVDERLLWYRSDGEQAPGRAIGDRMNGRGRWRPSIHMPRWASRLTLELTGVRVERVQDIREADAIAEGIEGPFDGNPANNDGKPFTYWRDYSGNDNYCTPRGSFRRLWESINGADAWERNDWVWALTFKPHLMNVDEFLRRAA